MPGYESIGDAEATALLRVDKADGRTLFYRVADGHSVQITQEDYEKEND